MDEKIRQALADEILGELQSLNDLELGSKEYQMAVDNITKLYRIGLDDIRNDNDYDEKWNRRKMDKEKEICEKAYRDALAREQKIDRYVKWGLDAAKIVLPLMFYSTWMKRGFKFEETGTYTSTTFRGLFSRFRPTEK